MSVGNATYKVRIKLKLYFALPGLVSVPSVATMEGVKRYINRLGNAPSQAVPKQTVMLDWVSKEDGSHLLTVAVANKVLILTAVSSDISQASTKAVNELRNSQSSRPVLRKSSSMGFQQFPEEIRWMQIRRIALRTADGLNPTPMAVSWVRDGILMCGMDNEIAVYSQWRQEATAEDNVAQNEDRNGEDKKDIAEHRTLQDEDIFNLAQESLNRSCATFTTLSGSSAGGSASAKTRKPQGEILIFA